ncbi:baseplate assembly protein [Rhodospira trueperi]|uniref:Baseplate J-like protein n=1 Tax=Rhodospira trueperi TaxID=69960 RepID=A0A1G7HY33_9PROT|nr:baseplate J/gp47 family protein [Rhodospira trueperi]SDF05034.1 Baseplate J-like protein [Rhodospira trueperi]
MTATSPRLNLSGLPAPAIIQGLDYEATLAALVADMKTALSEALPDWDGGSESDPVLILLQQFAYRIVVLTAAFNDAAKGALLAYATGSDLAHLAALLGTERLTVAEATDTTDAVMETDAALRARAQLAWEALSTAGPAGAYRYHAMEADGRVRDVSVASPTPGEVVVTVLGHTEDGTVTARETVTDLEVTLTGDRVVLDGQRITGLVVTDAALVTDYRWDAETATLTRTAGGAIPAGATLTVSYERAGVLELVAARLDDDDVRPVTDHVTVESATVLPYAVEATLYFETGPAAAPVLAAAEAALSDTVTDLHRLGADITRSALLKALRQSGVTRVVLTSPPPPADPGADVCIAVGPTQAAHCTGVTLINGGRDAG